MFSLSSGVRRPQPPARRLIPAKAHPDVRNDGSASRVHAGGRPILGQDGDATRSGRGVKSAMLQRRRRADGSLQHVESKSHHDGAALRAV